jgi:hypothetical protein
LRGLPVWVGAPILFSGGLSGVSGVWLSVGCCELKGTSGFKCHQTERLIFPCAQKTKRGKRVKEKERGRFMQNTNINDGVWISGEALKKFRDPKIQFEN